MPSNCDGGGSKCLQGVTLFERFADEIYTQICIIVDDLLYLRSQTVNDMSKNVIQVLKELHEKGIICNILTKSRNIVEITLTKGSEVKTCLTVLTNRQLPADLERLAGKFGQDNKPIDPDAAKEWEQATGS